MHCKYFFLNVIAFAVTLMPVAGLTASPVASPKTKVEAPAAAAKENTASIEDIRAFTAVFSLVKQAYVEEVDDHTLMQAAIQGLLAGLDPHSEYLNKRQLQTLTEDTSGRYAGVGIEVATLDGTLQVIAPFDGTPAARGGIKAGDIILRIDGKSVQLDSVDDGVERLRGKAGTEVTLTILHEGQTLPVDIKLKREIIHVVSVRGRFIEPGYAYLRIGQFQTETGTELRRELEKLNKAASLTGIKGVVLDLRSNPGGLLTSAVEISDNFLDEGLIVTTRGRLKHADLKFNATPGDVLHGVPIVLLVDNGTASAAEIVAGALKDHKRGVLMGRRTFGKGSVQTVLPLDDNSAIKLTTARYYTPNGTSIQAEGILPDIQLADLALAAHDSPPTLIDRERDLPRHLKSDGEKSEETIPIISIADDDYALNAALNVLKAMVLGHKPVLAAPAAQSKTQSE